jgi:hypothetical protein
MRKALWCAVLALASFARAAQPDVPAAMPGPPLAVVRVEVPEAQSRSAGC